MPILETGGSDSRFLRGAGIPSYGATGVFIDADDFRAHGRDERIRTRDFYGGLAFYDEFVKALAGHRNNPASLNYLLRADDGQLRSRA
jgi:acetylornithine deacetylase/succinyl-diaminopimelate desuccinylase-like protein